ncbi:NAD(P)-dependent oxidoreductase [Hwanghaeella grinnelliae]|uniref:NAD(P)-dependent oxidoreductase n=1 Tax=Hwanghaeella grinnelliae TaxID=2500179 RepID=A0A3S2ZBZ7_9PROT|nr:NAD(P)-dependent oxidoreductase [Hwanghaeella grinnelliae]RVU39088.1 NAD(P)-dependent oxidoreductase [Hwanghaeella grinnelliae]
MTTDNKAPKTIGFIGLGVMGEPMCRNLAVRRNDIGAPRMIAYDLDNDRLKRVTAQGVEAALSLAELANQSDLILMSLPGGKQVEETCNAANGVFAHVKSGATIIDLGTTPVDLTRSLAEKFASKNVGYMDAPVARTRQAAEQGTLAISVGGAEDVFAKVEPILNCFATDITYCGGSGSGQMVKILNNMILFETVAALAEALSVARKSGMDGEILFKALANGSADSFALRNHGMKALLPGEFPEKAFSTLYATKDLEYALDLAKSAGVTMPGAENVRQLFEKAAEQGYGENYWPVVAKVLDKPEDPPQE